MSARRHTLAVGLLAALLHNAGLAQTDAASVLLEQGKFWAEKRDATRAAEAWQRLLLIQPNRPEALYGLAVIELDAKRTSAAQGYLDKMRAAHPDSPLVAQLEQEMALRQGSRPKELDQARLLAESGNLDGAIAQYDVVLNGKPPQGPLALEYYNYLGYTTGGWQRARDGLERLARESPKSNQIKLALGKLLIRNEATRTEGIARLQQLSTVPEVAGDAAESARMGLVWLGTPRPPEIPLFQAHLKANPDDEEIRKQMNSVGAARATQAQANAAAPARSAGTRTAAAANAAPSAAVTDPVMTRAFKALESGDSASAEADFQARLRTHPDDADAMGGLGVIRMQQDRMRDAETLLTRAAQKNPRWRGALNSSRYWTLVNQANAAQVAGDSASARRLLDQASKLDPKQTGADMMRASMDVEAERLDAAEQTYRSVLTRNRNDSAALLGLVGVLAQNGKAAEARRLVDGAQLSDPAEMSRLRAAYASGAARAATQRGDDAAARAALEEAMRNDPNNVWIRLDLARLYTKAGRNREAQGLVDGLLASQPNNADALYASAMLAAELQEWHRALNALDRIPANRRNPGVIALQRRVWVNAQAASASELAKQGRRDEAMALLANAESVAGNDVGLQGALASAYVDAGDPARGLRMVRDIVARSPHASPDVLLQYAGILLKTGQDVESAGILRDLAGRDMTAGEHQTYRELRYLYTVRQAENMRERGDLVAAYDTLAPVLAERPNDPLAVGALARMYAASGDNKKALDLYKQLLEKDPDNASLHLGAAQMANQTKDYRYAAGAADTAVALAPDNPEILGGAGRIYRAQGKSSKAMELLKSAIALQQGNGQATAGTRAPTAIASSSADAANPFVGLPGQRSRSTLSQGDTGGASYGAVPTSSQTMVAVAPIGTAPAAYAATRRPATNESNREAATRATPSRSDIASIDVPAYAPQSSPAVAASQFSGSDAGMPARGVEPMPMASGRSTAALPARDARPAPSAPIRSAGAQPTRAPAPATVAYAPTPMGAATAAPVTVSVAESVAYAPYPAPAAGTERTAGSPAGDRVAATGEKTLAGELDEIMQERSPEFRLGTQVRTRNGESGVSKLTDVQTPMEIAFPVGDDRVTLRATPVSLNAGSIGTSYYSSSTFGGGPVSALNQLDGLTAGPGSQRQRGVGLSAVYATRGITADAGVTPLGFIYKTFTGGIRFDGTVDDANTLSYDFNVSRRPVTDSVLSFAGARDRRSGETFGGVSATGARLQLTKDFGDFGFYGAGSFYDLSGHNVASNNRTEVGAGLYYHLIRSSDSLLTTGLNASGIFYDRNLRYFTYGHGGYFSPQQFYALNVPLSWSQRSDNFTYQVRGSIGLQRFKENDADYFPGDGNRQSLADIAQASAVGRGLSGSSRAVYDGQTKTGIGYSLGAAGEYRVAPQLYFGGSLAMDNASDYRQLAGGLYMRYMFYPQSGQMALPVSPYRSP